MPTGSPLACFVHRPGTRAGISGPPSAGYSSRYDDVQQARNFAIGGYGGAALLGGLGIFLWTTE